MDISCIEVTKAIPGVTGVEFGRCTTLDEVLAAMAADSGPTCCPAPTVAVPAEAFANPQRPTQADVDAWAAANGPWPAGTLLTYAGNGGSATDPEYVWEIDPAGAAISIESPIPLYDKLDYHPVLPIADVPGLEAAQPLLNSANVFETEDTNEITLTFGEDGRLRAKRRLYASHMRFNGLSAGIPPSSWLTVPFNSMVFNHGGAAALGSTAHFTAPFDCVVEVQGLVFFSNEAWLTGAGAGQAAGTNAAVAGLWKNGALHEQFGIDYNFKGGIADPVPAATANEYKVASGGLLVECAAGDTLLIRAANGKTNGTNHTFFYAYGSFHIVGAI
jgi:hypothetical protein